MERGHINFLIVKNGRRKVNVSFSRAHKLNVLNSKVIKSYLLNIVSHPGTSLIIDLKGIDFIDSEAFDTLNVVSRIAKSYNSEITLINVSDDILELIDLVRTYSVFDIKNIKSSNRKKIVA